MGRLIRHWLFGIALLVCATGSASAQANGVKFGDGRVHPFFQIESRYDSAAVMVRPERDGPYKIAGDMVLHFKPGLKLENPSEKIFVGLNGALDYVLYTGAVDAGTRYASNLQGEADLVLGINRGGQFSVDIGDHIVRSDRVGAPVISVGVLSIHNDARIVASYRPSGGALTLEPAYHFTSEFFSANGDQVIVAGCQAGDPTCDAKAVSGLNYLNHSFKLNGRWRFLPKTAFTFDSVVGMRRYVNDGGTPLNTLKASLGLAGLLTTHFSTVLKLGWGHDLSADTFSTLIAQAEVGYILSQTGQIRLGYLRTFEPIAGKGYVSYGDDRGYLDARLLLGGRLTLRGYAALDFLGFRDQQGNEVRSDFKLTADLGADWEIKRWLSVGAGLLASTHSSDATIAVGLDEFRRNEIYARVQVIY
jgi:hypothetical protein